VRNTFLARWRASFFAGLAVTLPAIVSVAAMVWLFRTASNFTDTLLFFLKFFLGKKEIYENGQSGDMFWYWSVLAFALAVILISIIGLLARYYIGKRILEWLDTAMMKVPLLNKVYGAIKQLNEAFSGNKNSFKTVVLVEFPGPGNYAVGFLTNEAQGEVQKKSGKNLVAVFIPTTPNPTSGFLILVPEEKVTKLDMSVADGIKYIVSLGSIAPELPAEAKRRLKMEDGE
jgi:uncharacterized membrane protein